MRGAIIRHTGAFFLTTALCAHAQSVPFVISVEEPPEIAAKQAGTLNLRYAPETRDPLLNVQGWVHNGPKTPVEFRAWSNYTAFLDRTEIRILLPGADPNSEPLDILPIRPGGIATWSLGADADGDVDYVLRAYDARGNFDQTAPKRLTLGTGKAPTRGELLYYSQENSLQQRRIRVSGGAVTADGSGVGRLERVIFLGQEVPVDANGRFTTTQILPRGTRILGVEVVDGDGRILRRTAQDVAIADEDWFYVGLADVTIGQNNTSGPIQTVTGDDQFDENIFVDGRVAFYLKGKVRGDWLLTAAADTGEGPIEEIFDNFLDKDPRSVLRRLDPDQFYPVYGDTSTAINDAPTDGKLFVRLEKGPSEILWGNFKTQRTNTAFTNFSRSLYGARLRTGTAATTSTGEPRGQIEVFAADPGTVQSREEFRGTGGSLYYLRHRDLLRGSERAHIETRDPVTGLVLARQELASGTDYEMNAMQGRIQLLNPLLSSGASGGLVSGSTSTTQQFLVVTYEYSPGVISGDDLVMGASGSYWVSNRIKLGANTLRQDGTVGQSLAGLDATYYAGPKTYIRVEGAQSEDGGNPSLRSIDGGFTFTTIPGAASGDTAGAARVEIAADLAELGRGDGDLRIVWQRRDAGFSGPGAQTNEDVTQLTADANITTSARSKLHLKFDEKTSNSQTTTAMEANVNFTISPRVALSAGLRQDDITTTTTNASTALSTNGSRLDGVLRLDYALSPRVDVYGYVQGTLDKSGSRVDNNRAALGGTWTPNKRLSLGGEVSDGDGGLGARLTGSYHLDKRSRIYSSYDLANDREASNYQGRLGQFTLGGSSRVTENVTLLAEQNYQHGDGPSGITNAFGIEYAPEGSWTVGLKAEAGALNDPVNGDLTRRAISFDGNYGTKDAKFATRLEYRSDAGADTRETWTTRNSASVQTSQDWRVLGRVSASTSNTTAATGDTEFVEVVTGAAYRPVDNDRLNVLFKYTYLYDTGTPGQVGAGSSALDYAQISHVLSVDAIFDVTPKLSVGGKLGARVGSIKDTSLNGPWIDSDATLAIARADYRLSPSWDMLGEYRMLETTAADASQSGALIGVYRRFNENVKLGAGYNMTDFSDDLTDQSYSSRGWFVNLIGKF